MSQGELGKIQVALGVNVNSLTSQVAEARKQINSLAAPAGSARVVTFNVHVASQKAREDIKQVGTHLQAALATGFTLKPKIQTSPGIMQAYLRDVNREVKSAAVGIVLPIKAAKIDAAAFKRDIMASIPVIDIPIDWHWRDGHGPDGGMGGPSGGGPPGGGTGPGSTQRTERAAVTEAAARERSARAARAQADADTNAARQGTPVGESRPEAQSRTRRTRAERQRAADTEREANAEHVAADQAAAAAARRPRPARSATPAAAAQAAPETPEPTAAAQPAAGRRRAARQPAATPEPAAAPPVQEAAVERPTGGRMTQTPKPPRVRTKKPKELAVQQEAAEPEATGESWECLYPECDRKFASMASREGHASSVHRKASIAQRAKRPQRVQSPVRTEEPERGLAGESRRLEDILSYDTLKAGHGQNYTEKEMEAHAAEALQRRESDPRRVRGRRSDPTSTLGINDIASSGGVGVRGIRGVSGAPAIEDDGHPRRLPRGAVVDQGLDGPIVPNLEAATPEQARRYRMQQVMRRQEEMLAADEAPGSDKIREAFRAMEEDDDISQLHSIDPQMAGAMEAYLEGNHDVAIAISKTIIPQEISNEGTGGKKRARRIRRAQGSKVDPYSQQPIDIARSGMAGAIIGAIQTERDDDARVRVGAGKGQRGVAPSAGRLRLGGKLITPKTQAARLRQQAGIVTQSPSGGVSDTFPESILPEPMDLPDLDALAYIPAAPLDEGAVPQRHDWAADDKPVVNKPLSPEKQAELEANNRAAGVNVFGRLGEAPVEARAQADPTAAANRAKQAQLEQAEEQRKAKTAQDAAAAAVKAQEAAAAQLKQQKANWAAAPQGFKDSLTGLTPDQLQTVLTKYRLPIDEEHRREKGGPVTGGLLGRLLKSTLDERGTIKPGQEEKSARYNALLGIKAGGTSESGGAIKRAKGGPIRPRSMGFMVPTLAELAADPELDDLAEALPKGRPGIHYQRNKPTGDKLLDKMYRMLGDTQYITARDSQSRLVGSLKMAPDGVKGPLDVYPYVHPDLRGQGIGTSLYQRAEEMGLPVDVASNANVASEAQSAHGHALWRKRMRLKGMTDEQIAKMEQGTEYAGVDWSKRLPSAPPGEMMFVSEMPGGIMERRAAGGSTTKGTYLVGEKGPEVFVPQHDGWIIPNHLMSLLPKRAEGGTVERGGTGPLPGETPEMMQAAGLRRVDMGRSGSRFFGARGMVSRQGAEAQLGRAFGEAGVQRVFVTNWPPPASTGATGPPMATPAPTPRESAYLGAQQRANQPPAPTASTGAQQEAETGGGGASPAGEDAPAAVGTMREAVPKVRSSPRPGVSGSARTGARDAVEELRDRIGQVSTGISDALQLTPVRALSVSIGQQAQELFGGRRDIRERARVAGRLNRVAGQSVGDLQASEQTERDLKQQIAEDRAEGVDPSIIEGKERKLARAQINTADLRVRSESDVISGEIATVGEARVLRDRPEDADLIKREAQALRDRADPVDTKGVLQRGNVLKSQAIGVGGIVAGTVLFSTAMSIANTGLELLGNVAMKSVDALSGFAATANKVSGELATAIVERSGDPGAVAGYAGSIGIGVETFDGSAIGRRAMTEAGNLQVQKQVDFLRADRFADSRYGTNAIPGIGVGLGNGILGSWINQTPGAIEQVGGLADPRRGVPQAAPFKPGPNESGLDTIRRLLVGNDINAPEGQITTNEPQGAARAVETAAHVMEQVAKVVDDGRYGSLISGATETELAASRTALSDAGVSGPVQDQYERAGVAVVGADGAAPTSQSVNDLFGAFLEGSLIKTPELMLKDMERSMAAQVRSIGRQSTFQQDVVMPAEFAQQALSRGGLPTSIGQGISAAGSPTLGALGGEFAGVDAATTSSLANYSGRLTEIRGQLGAMQSEGEAALRDLGVPQESIDSLRAYGEEIRDLRERGENLQLGLETAQYNRQLALSKRSLGDLVGLQGKSFQIVKATVGINKDGTVQAQNQTVQATRLGEVQRQQMMLGRESTSISLAANQRSINFNAALSQIDTPGSTPAERYTRAIEADAIRAEAQKQQDISVKQNTLGIEAQEIGISRDLKQNIITIQELTAGRAISIELRGIDKAVEGVSMLIDRENKLIDVAQGVGQSLFQMAETAQTAIETATGEFNDSFRLTVDESLATLVTQYSAALGEILGSIPGGLENATVGWAEGKQEAQPAGWTPYTGPGSVPVVGDEVYGPPAPSDVYGPPAPSNLVDGEYQDGGSAAPGSQRARGGAEQTMNERQTRAQEARALAWGAMGATPLQGFSQPTISTGGGSSFVVQFMGDVNVRDDDDIDKLVRMVEQALNRKAATLGITPR